MIGALLAVSANNAGLSQEVSSETLLPQMWSSAECVDYAKAHNITLRQTVLTKESGLCDLEAAKAQ